MSSLTHLSNRYGYHLVESSPYPLLVPLVLLSLFVNVSYGSLVCFFVVVGLWLRDVVLEGTVFGMHTLVVQNSLLIATLWFILSELVLFLSVFAMGFYCTLLPSVHVGCLWPPMGVTLVDPYGVALFNTLLLLVSSVSFTVAHNTVVVGKHGLTLGMTGATLGLGLVFLGLQGYEYSMNSFSLHSSLFGALFYIATGLHGLHIVVGLGTMGLSLLRAVVGHNTTSHHLGFVLSVLYWHVIDVLWLGVYAFFYVY